MRCACSTATKTKPEYIHTLFPMTTGCLVIPPLTVTIIAAHMQHVLIISPRPGEIDGEVAGQSGPPTAFQEGRFATGAISRQWPGSERSTKGE